MPTYSYKCKACNEETEILKSHTEIEKAETCKKCGSELTRVITAGARFIKKGAGWYSGGRDV